MARNEQEVSIENCCPEKRQNEQSRIGRLEERIVCQHEEKGQEMTKPNEPDDKKDRYVQEEKAYQFSQSDSATGRVVNMVMNSSKEQGQTKDDGKAKRPK